MASVLKVDKLDPQSGTALEIGTSGDTVTVPTGAGLTVVDEVKTNKISPATGTAFALGDSGDTFTVPSGATIVNSGTATGFGGGKILQVVRSTEDSTTYTTTSSSPQLAFISSTMTLASSSNLVFVCFTFLSYFDNVGIRCALYRSPTASVGTTIDGGTLLTTGTEPQTAFSADANMFNQITLTRLDTPGATDPFYGLGFWEHPSNTGNSQIYCGLQIAEMTLFEVEA